MVRTRVACMKHCACLWFSHCGMVRVDTQVIWNQFLNRSVPSSFWSFLTTAPFLRSHMHVPPLICRRYSSFTHKQTLTHTHTHTINSLTHTPPRCMNPRRVQLEVGRFKGYAVFCSNQNPASELYVSLMETRPDFVAAMTACEARTDEARGFDLPAFLLKGLQRLLKYKPLLRQILKYTRVTDGAQLHELNEAIRLLEENASVINDGVRAMENARRLPKIQAQLVMSEGTRWIGQREVGVDLTSDPSRRLIHEGRLQVLRCVSGVRAARASQSQIHGQKRRMLSPTTHQIRRF